MFLYLTRLSTFFRINDVMTWMQGPGVGGRYVSLAPVHHACKSPSGGWVGGSVGEPYNGNIK